MNKHRYLTDDQGHPSSMRLMSMIALVAAIVFGLLTLLHEKANDVNGLYLTASFLIAAFAPKALQKFAEAQFPQLAPAPPAGAPPAPAPGAPGGAGAAPGGGGA